MAVTTEPGLRVARSKDITNEDYAQTIDRIKPAKYPLSALARTEIKLKAVDRTRNVDAYPSPKGAVGRADNESAPASGDSGSRDWSANIRKIGNVAQAFSETFRIGWIAEEVPQIAGLSASPLSYAKAGAIEMLKQHMEVAASSFDQVAVYDQSPGLGAVAAGYRMLTDYNNRYAAASVYAIGKPSDVHYAPTGATLGLTSLTAAPASLTANHSRAMWKNVALALFLQVKEKKDWMALLSPSLRQAVTDLTIPSQVTTTGTTATNPTTTSDQVRVLLRNEADSVLGATVDVIQTDFGRFLVADSMYIGTTTTDSTGGALTAVNTASATRALASFVQNLKAGLIIDRSNVSKTWGIMPTTEELGKTGGGDAYDVKCLAVPVQVDNPQRAGWLAFS